MKSGKVLTNIQQSLTSDEKAQARANIGAASIDVSLFVQPAIFSGMQVPYSGTPSLHLVNISDSHSLALIGLRPIVGYHVNAGDIFEVVLNGIPYIGTANFSMGLFKLVGHPTAGSSDPVTFRRLTAPLAPRPLTGVRNDGGIPPYGFSPVAANPIRFTFDENANFGSGELLYLGIAVSFNSDVPNGDPVIVGAFPQIPVYDYNDPISVVNPVYYALGQSDKIDAEGFTAREFTINYSGADFSYASTFDSSTNILTISAGGISASRGKTYPCGIMLVKYVPDDENTVEIGGSRYRTVTINGVTWLAENLDYKFSGLIVGQAGGSLSDTKANYYDNDEGTYGVNGKRYGLLYNWAAVKYLEDHKAELIPGWHVPTMTEWGNLVMAVGGASTAGTKLKSTTGWDSDNGDGSYDFAAFPTGFVASGSAFYNLGDRAHFWTITEYSSSMAYSTLFTTGPSIDSDNYTKEYGYSLRLVKD